MSSRTTILNKLRKAAQPFKDVPLHSERLAMVPDAPQAPEDLQARFVAEAEAVGCTVYCASSDEDVIPHLLEMLRDYDSILGWDESYLPVSRIYDALQNRGVTIAEPAAIDVRAGITGVDAALAVTGSLVLQSGAGKYRLTSLLPDLHVALVKASQIIPDFETWIAQQRQGDLTAFRESSNTIIITGPSKTADIAQELILGAHGPKRVHIVLITSA